MCYAGAISFGNDAESFRQICEPAEAHLMESAKGLVRTIGRWSLAALMVNTMIGASIFGLPALIAARLGKWSPLGFLVAFAGISIIAACMAEVASQFREAGGPYLYARAAFGDDPEEVHRAYSAGGADYLVKPLDPEIVRKKVAVFVELSRRRSESESRLKRTRLEFEEPSNGDRTDR